MARQAQGTVAVSIELTELDTQAGIAAAATNLQHVAVKARQMSSGTANGEIDRVWSTASGSVGTGGSSIDLVGTLTSQIAGGATTSFADVPLHQGHHRGKPVGPWHLAAMAGAGGLRAPASDLLRFLEAVRDGGGPLDEAIAETQRPRTDRGRLQVGLGWFLLGDGDVLMHDGGTLGASSEVRLERHSGTAVVVLGDSRRGTERAAGMLLNPG